jgi:hypothetical protein
MNEKQQDPNKPECLTLARLFDLVEFNASAYWAHTYVTKKMKYFEYGTTFLGDK